ncbi:uncharacterized protein UDID_04954 [Ustilago sp. UG-2017a]|nr:uncharacterized protein UDID_04954 [Ustilago sp. UG-2017a]
MDGTAETSRSPRRSSSAWRQGSDASMSSRCRSRSPTPPPPPLQRSLAPSRTESHTPSHSSGPGMRVDKTALRITHLTSNVGESHLRHIFGWYGDVVRVHLTQSRPNGGQGRDASAHVLMGSVEHAAKAALYMGGGQIDGAIISIKTCEAPDVLPPQETRARVGGRNGRDGQYPRDGFEDRRNRGRAALPPPREREWAGAGPSRGLHPDHQRMFGGGRSRGRYHVGHSRDSGGASKMRPWGQRAQGSTSRRRHIGDRRRERSVSRSKSPPSQGRRRSSTTTRASPTY